MIMRPLSVACALIVCLFASGHAFANESIELDDAVDYHREVCIAPYYEGKDQDALLSAMIEKNTAESFLNRLAIGAPPNWQALSDHSVDLKKRLQAGIDLIGMAISHGGSEEKRIAKAYSVMYIPVPPGEDCQLPEGLAKFVKDNDFWR